MNTRHAPETGADTVDFPARLERFASVDSTQRIVAEWLAAGTPEVAVAVADEQTAGRGRLDRTWTAPAGAALLCSIGFRPAGLGAGHAWRLAAVVSLAMLDAAEDVAGLRDGRLRLKWPNDLVVRDDDAAVGAAPGDAAPPDGAPSPDQPAMGSEAIVLRKVAGVLGESDLGPDGTIRSAVVGIGVNADWPASAFPPALAAGMSSLREVSGGRPIDREQLLDAFLSRLEARYEALRAGRFDAGAWSSRQVTTGLKIEIATGEGILRGRASGVDPESGSLLLVTEDGERSIGSGDIVRCRVIG